MNNYKIILKGFILILLALIFISVIECEDNNYSKESNILISKTFDLTNSFPSCTTYVNGGTYLDNFTSYENWCEDIKSYPELSILAVTRTIVSDPYASDGQALLIHSPLSNTVSIYTYKKLIFDNPVKRINVEFSAKPLMTWPSTRDPPHGEIHLYVCRELNPNTEFIWRYPLNYDGEVFIDRYTGGLLPTDSYVAASGTIILPTATNEIDIVLLAVDWSNIRVMDTYIDYVKIEVLEWEDNTSPTIKDLFPENNGIYSSNLDKISATYSDESGIDVSTLRVILDGEDITSLCIADQNGFYFDIPAPLDIGKHNISLSISDSVGNKAEADWKFEIAPIEIKITADKTTLRSGGKDSTFIYVKLVDIGDSPIENQIVNFSIDSGTIFPVSAFTDSNGIAKTLLTSSNEKGKYVFNASTSLGSTSLPIYYSTSAPPIEKIVEKLIETRMQNIERLIEQIQSNLPSETSEETSNKLDQVQKLLEKAENSKSPAEINEFLNEAEEILNNIFK